MKTTIKTNRSIQLNKKILETVKAVWPETKTRRGLNNKYHLFCAMQALKKCGKRVDWLFGGINNPNSEQAKHKITILTELGRLREKDLICDCALQICELKPTTKKAVSILQQLRTGKIIEEVTPLELAKQAFVNLSSKEKQLFTKWQLNEKTKV